MDNQRVLCEHRPIIANRSVGPSIFATNYCAECGAIIYLDANGQWTSTGLIESALEELRLNTRAEMSLSLKPIRAIIHELAEAG